MEQAECHYILVSDLGDCLKLVQDTDVIVIEKQKILELINALNELSS